MKKNIIALAIASAVAAPVAMADAPTIYGQLNLNLANIDGNDTTVNSTDSRLGVKGSEDLGDGLKAVYKVEFALNEIADDSDKGTIGQRNAYLGLAGGFGTVLMGRHDTPTKMIQPKDLFPDGAADIKNLTNGIATGEDRSTDVLAYVSPSFGGVKVIAASVLGEKDRADNVYNSNWANIAATYGSTSKGLYLAGSWMDASDIDATVIRLSGQYAANGLIASAMYQDVTGDDAKASGLTGDFTQLQAGYKIGKFMPKVKYVMADSDANGNEDAFALGLNYSLGKKTTAYIYTADRDSMVDKDGKTVANANWIMGMVHKF